MINEKQKQIIRLLLSSKDGYNINQIARILNISVSWTHETLKLLEKEGILIAVKLGNALFFRINWQNPKTQKICELILIDDKNNNIVKDENSHEKKQLVYTPLGSYHLGYYIKPTIQSTGSLEYVSPVGEQGINNTLFSYARSGAFSSNSGYSPVVYISKAVPQGTLGSKISNNVGGFSLAMHTSGHKAIVSGCRYCGPEIKI